MKILIVGTGYVGTTTGLIFCEKGHQVTGLDLDMNKINALQSGKLHFYEPGLGELLARHSASGQITFTNDTERAIKENDIIFICVGTPQGADGSANLMYVESVAKSIGTHMEKYTVIVDKSTVPVGTAGKVREWILEAQKTNIPFDVVSNPEFLREGSALFDAMNPDRIVIGTSSSKAAGTMKELYKDFQCPIVETKAEAAELIKYAANSFLALKISYINEIARLCDALNIDVNDISRGIGLDQRVGQQFLKAGIGYGGSCFPKDVQALLHTANSHKVPLPILDAAVRTNETQPLYFIEKISEALGRLSGKNISVLGLAFKADTDDVRESPALKIINHLVDLGAQVRVHDPVVIFSKQGVAQYKTIEEAVDGSDAVLLCTDWAEYKEISWDNVRSKMNAPFIFDGRNFLNPDEMRKLGFVYDAVGR